MGGGDFKQPDGVRRFWPHQQLGKLVVPYACPDGNARLL